MNLGESSEFLAVSGSNNVNFVTGTNQSCGQAFCEPRGPVDIRWEGVATDHNAHGVALFCYFGHFIPEIESWGLCLKFT